MNDAIILILVGSVCLVFVGAFIASLFIPNYQGFALVAPVMTAAFGVVAGLALAKRNGGGA